MAGGLSPRDRVDWSLKICLENSVVFSFTNPVPLDLEDTEVYKKIEDHARLVFDKESKSEPDYIRPGFWYGACEVTVDKEVLAHGLPLLSALDWKSIYDKIHDYRKAIRTRKSSHVRLRVYRDYVPSWPQDVDQESMSNDLYALMRTGLDGKVYLPNSALKMLFPPERIRSVIKQVRSLKSCTKEERDRFADTLHDPKQKTGVALFALCVFARFDLACLKSMVDKRAFGIFKFNFAGKNLCHNELNDPKTRSCETGLHDLRTNQGQFNSVIFDGEGTVQRLQDDQVIPMRYCNEGYDYNDVASRDDNPPDSMARMARGQRHALLGRGAFSHVYCVRIHPEQHHLAEDKEAHFALKIFIEQHTSPTSTFERELKVLNALRKLRHKHILTLLETFIQNGKCLMLFPYADCNLKQYMAHNRFSSCRDDSVSWLLEQLVGLADGLSNIHELQESKPDQGNKRLLGWHHDIKPANVLYFAKSDVAGGTLKITDFGSSKIQTYRSGSCLYTRTTHGTLTYQAPEADGSGKHTRSYDVWSLGCVFLELLTWARGGFDAVEAFAEKRKANETHRGPRGAHGIEYPDDVFWEADGTEKKVRRAVTSHIRDLRQEASRNGCGGFGACVDVVDEMLNATYKDRIKSKAVLKKLQEVLEKHKADSRRRVDTGEVDHDSEDAHPSTSLGAEISALSFTEIKVTGPQNQSQHNPHKGESSKSGRKSSPRRGPHGGG